MANPTLQTGISGWVGNLGLNQGRTELRIETLRKRFSGLRIADSDHAINAGYTPDNQRRFKRKFAEVMVLHRQCEDLQEKYRNNVRLADDLVEARQMVKETEGASNPDEHRKSQATADAMLAFLISHRPEAVTLFRGIDLHCPELIDALHRVQVAVPDSQPINDAMRLAEDVPRLQEENAALQSTIDTLKLEREASDKLVKEANDSLDKLRIEKQESEKSLRDEGAKKDQEIGRLSAEKDNLERALGVSNASRQEMSNELDSSAAELERVRDELKTSRNEAQLASHERDQACENVGKLKLDLDNANVSLIEANDRVAKESKTLDDVRKTLELARKDSDRVPTLEYQVREANTKVNQLKTDQRTSLEEGMKVKAERDQALRDISALEFKLNDAEQSDKEGRKDLSESMVKVEQLRRKVVSLENDLQKEVETSKEQTERSKESIAELKRVQIKKERYRKQRNILLKYKDEAERLETKLQGTRRELEQCKGTLASVKEKADESEAARDRYLKHRDVLLKCKEKTEEDLQITAGQLQECRETLKDVQGSMALKEEQVLATAKEKRDLDKEKSRVTQTLDETLEALKAARVECGSQKAEIDQLTSSYQEKVEECAYMDGVLEIARANYQELEARVRVLMESLRLESQTKAILEENNDSLRESKRQLEDEIDGLRGDSIKKVDRVDRFLTGSDNSGLHSSIGRLLAGEGQDAVNLRSIWRPRWTLLPAWGAEPDEIRSNAEVLLIELVAAGRNDDWGVKSKGLSVLRQLKEALVNGEGITAGTDELISKALNQVLKEKELCFMARVAVWQNLWLLQKRWGSEPVDLSLQGGRDNLIQALALDDSIPTAQLGNGGYMQVHNLILFRPRDEVGVVVADDQKFTLQWVAQEYIKLAFQKVIFTRTLLPDVTLELGGRQLDWAYINL